MCFVREFGTRDAGEKIFRTAGKSRDFVRNGRTEDQDVIVDARFEQVVYRERNGFVEQTTGYFSNLISRQFADRHEVVWVVPTVVKDGSFELFGRADLF